MLERSIRILVAENRPLVLVTVTNMLNDAGYIVEGAIDGKSALERLSAAAPAT